MTKQLIVNELSERHVIFVNYVLSLSYKEFTFSFQNKWTAGQQMDHLFRSTAILPLAFKIPTFITAFIFGKANRLPVEYEELVQQYISKLEEGAKATAMFVPKKIPYGYRIDLADKLLNNISKLNAIVDIIPEKELDKAMLPHPILGRITYREMLYFTMYHVNHHCALTKKYVGKI